MEVFEIKPENRVIGIIIIGTTAVADSGFSNILAITYPKALAVNPSKNYAR